MKETVTKQDIISNLSQKLELKNKENMISFCKGIQKAAPMDSHVTPEPWAMPGYNDDVIIAAGAFVQRSFGLYVFHYFSLTLTTWLLARYAKIPAVPTYAIATFASFFGAFVLYEAVVRIPFVRWCLLGIKKRKYA